MNKNIVILSGEASGDIIGANLINELNQRYPQQFTFYGITGQQMRDAGCQTWLDQRELNVMGLAEVLPHIPKLLRHIKTIKQKITALNPDVVISIDAPDFTLRIMKYLNKARQNKKIDSKLIHYVAPSVWAWKEYRSKKLAKIVDHLLCLYPFEPPYFTLHGLNTTFVGHPVLQSNLQQGQKDIILQMYPQLKNQQIIGILPGSRRQEIKNILPLIMNAKQQFQKNHKTAQFLILAAPHVAEEIKRAVLNWPNPPIIIDNSALKHHAFASMDFAVAASGTVTLELGYAMVPTIVTYIVNPITAYLVKRLIKIRFASLINILANDMIFPEYIQEKATINNIYAAMNDFADKTKLDFVKKRLLQTIALLNPGDKATVPAQIAADVVISLMDKQKSVAIQPFDPNQT